VADESDVLIPQRDEKGHFLPGNKIRPLGKPGPMTKEEKAPYLKAITETFTAEDLSQMLIDAWNTADKAEDWRGKLELIRFVASYAVGKPVQRTLSATINPEDLLRIFAPPSGGDSGTPSTTIEVTTTESTEGENNASEV
jgi:hypothetical protein